MSLYDEYKRTMTQYQSTIPSNIVRKWKMSIEKLIDIENESVYEKICLFCEYYQSTLNNIPRIASPVSIQTGLPKDVYSLQEATDYIIENLKMFIVENDFTKLKIVEEYYNVMTGKKGMLLDGGVRIEDGKLLNPKHQQKIDNELIKNIDNSIEFVLNPELRQKMLRSKKIERIIN